MTVAALQKNPDINSPDLYTISTFVALRLHREFLRVGTGQPHL